MDHQVFDEILKEKNIKIQRFKCFPFVPLNCVLYFYLRLRILLMLSVFLSCFQVEIDEECGLRESS